MPPGPPHHRDRLRRAASTGGRPARSFHRYLNPERADRRGRRRRCTASRRNSCATSRSSPSMAGEFLDFLRRRRTGDPQRGLRPRLPRRRIRALLGAAAGAMRRPLPRARYPGARARALPRASATTSTRCASVTRRQQPPRPAWRAARCALLADVYLAMTAGQGSLALAAEVASEAGSASTRSRSGARVRCCAPARPTSCATNRGSTALRGLAGACRSGGARAEPGRSSRGVRKGRSGGIMGAIGALGRRLRPSRSLGEGLP